MSYTGVQSAELALAASHTAWVSPITRHRVMTCLKDCGEREGR